MKLQLGLIAIALGCTGLVSVSNISANSTTAVESEYLKTLVSEASERQRLQSTLHAATGVLQEQERVGLEEKRQGLDKKYSSLKNKQESLQQQKERLEKELQQLGGQLQKVDDKRKSLNVNLAKIVAEAEAAQQNDSKDEMSSIITEFMGKMKTAKPDIDQKRLAAIESSLGNTLLEQATIKALDKTPKAVSKKVVKPERELAQKTSSDEKKQDNAFRSQLSQLVGNFVGGKTAVEKPKHKKQAVTVAAAPPSDKGKSYLSQLTTESDFTTIVVQAGDSLTSIARRVYGNADKAFSIFESNKDIISNPNIIPIGKILKLLK